MKTAVISGKVKLTIYYSDDYLRVKPILVLR